MSGDHPVLCGWDRDAGIEKAFPNYMKWESRVATNQRHINASPEQVFDVLSNGWLFPSWVVGASRIRDVDADWPGVTAKLHHSFGVWPVLIDDSTSILEWDPPRHVKLRARGWPIGEANVTLDIQRQGARCFVRMHEDAVEGPGRFVPKPIRTLGLLIRNRETLQRLAWLAEGQSSPAVSLSPES